METQYLICIVGFIVITYFLAKPKKVIKKDKLTKEVGVRGLPPRFPSDGGGYIP